MPRRLRDLAVKGASIDALKSAGITVNDASFSLDYKRYLSRVLRQSYRLLSIRSTTSLRPSFGSHTLRWGLILEKVETIRWVSPISFRIE
jgi:hypothetical protein